MIKKWIFMWLIIGFLMNPWDCFSFNLSVTPTAETCSGNGSLTFVVTNHDPSGSILFFIYRLPDTTVPIATITSNSLTGLTTGDYLVIAKETVGNVSTTQQQNATISNNIVPLAYAVKTLNQACSTTSNITIETISGTPATYQIISGPVLFPTQTDNTFKGLPTGVYKVKVVDICGNSVVQTFTITLNQTNISVGQPVFSDLTPVDCSKIKVSQTISPAPGTVIGYPITVEYKLYPPGAPTPTIINKTLASGDLTSQEITEVFPSFINQSYSYSITITDACGKTYPVNNFQVTQQLNLIGNVMNLDCDEYAIKLSASNYAPPYTLNFDSFPSGFDPKNYNSTYPGPYNSDEILFGSKGNDVPLGDYTITITDACARTVTIPVKVISKPPQISAVSFNNGCLTNSGLVRIEIPNYHIVTAIITSAPTDYPSPLPHDVTSIVDSNGVLLLNPLPLGDYTIEVTDTCGDILPPVDITVPVYEDLGIISDLRPGCDLDKTSIKIASNNGKLKSVIITAAPSTFAPSLPYDASEYIITEGKFYMDNLLSGDYTFSTVDECDFTALTIQTLDGYTITNNSFSLVSNCGSYDIPLDYVSNVTTPESFWLQKKLPSGSWGHPASNLPYTEETVPNDSNSLLLNNNTTNYNLTYNGTFRIIHYFMSYNNGKDFNDGFVDSVDKNCLEILNPTMYFDHVLEIVEVYRMPCNANGNLDVVVVANGTPPLDYSIIDSNGNKILDNGNNNIFSNLPPGIYRFQVEDSCGNTVNSTFDVSNLVSLAKINPICDQSQCVSIVTGNELFDLTSLNAAILGDQDPSKYTLNYYTSLNDAQTDNNPISNPLQFDPNNNPQTIYIRLYYTALPKCYEIDNFDLIVAQIPKLNLKSTYMECDTKPVVLNAGAGNPPSISYLWSNGSTNPSVMISQIGVTNISVTASNMFGMCDNEPLACLAEKDIKVVISDIPAIQQIDIQDWTENENTITVISAKEGDFEYSIDGINYQMDNHFTGLAPGFYIVYVRDLNGCRTISKKVALLNYPRFFTPNGDGYHENWFIKNSEFEPDFRVDIFDRYGKLMISFDSKSGGWDGTYNSRMMPSDDYWFVVYRQDGNIYKGHFALKR